MTSDRWSDVFRLFEAAIEQPESAREVFLEDACAGDGALRAEVEAMLAADARALPLLGMKGPSLATAFSPQEVPGAAGQHVGPYRILRELGRGGMGAVYLAERDDVGKQVALKLVRGALASPETLERFRVEQKILARLEHRHIAALLDAGVTPDGTPWFAMEKVQGKPLTTAADHGQLPLEARLHLFEQVCEAVAYAHQLRIVHRDLKPSNILVDGEGTVKLLDFGIAKLLGEESSGSEGLTRTGLRPMTPEYAAPEQVLGAAVTPATDVYALGAVLYELLTGHRPQRVRGGSLADIERVVLHTDPPLPSTAVGRMEEVAGAEGGSERITPAAVAAARGTVPQQLRRRLAGDLDAIVMRAMAKEPARRYASAEALLADLRAHREGRPIAARPYTWRYRLRKFAGRHSAGMASAAVAAVLLGGLGTLFAQNLAVSRDPTRAAAATALQLGQYVTRMFAAAESVEAGTTVAVYPFTFHGSAEWEHLAEGMPRLVGTKLDGATGGLRVFDPRALSSHLGREMLPIRDAQRGAALAVRLGAGIFVLGDIVEARGRLRITAALYRAGADQPRLMSEASVEGEANEVFSLVDELGARLLAHVGTTGQLGNIAAYTTDSPQALLAFLEGERALRESRYAEAAEAFRRAIGADTTFALAYYGLSRAANWMDNVVAEGNAAAMALHHASRLAPQDRLLIQAWSFYRTGDVVPADSLYRAVLLERPHDVEAWTQLGEVGFHFGSMLGHPAVDSREPFERVLGYEPDNVSAMIHLARLAAQEREFERMDSLIHSVVTFSGEGSQAFQLTVLRSLTLGELELPRHLSERLLLVDAATLRGILMAAAAHSGNLDRALWLADHTAGRLALPNGGAWAQLIAAQLDLARGRWDGAQARLEVLGRQMPELSGEFRAAFLTFPLLEVPAAEIAAARDAHARTSAATHLLTNRAIAQRRLYLLGSLSARLGDTAAARIHVDSLERYAHASTAGDSAFNLRFALELRAQLAWLDGRPADALALLGPPAPQPDYQRPALTSYYKANERWLRAEALRALGRDAEALRWYATFPDPDAYDLIYLAPSHLRRAQIHEQRSERELAARHYRRFMELWADADPRFQPLVRQAQRQLAGLQ